MASFFAISLVKVEEEGYEPQIRLRVQEAATPLEFVALLKESMAEDSKLKPIEMICIQGNILPLMSDGSKIEIAKNEYQLTNITPTEYTSNPVYLGGTTSGDKDE